MLRIPDVHEKFKTTFPKPEFQIKKDIIAPPLTNNYSIVGQAFDYFLRFHLKQKFPEHTIGGEPWVAELGLEMMRERNLDPLLFKEAELILDSAKKAYTDFLTIGNNSLELAKYCILLAKIDLFFRVGGGAAPHTIQELYNVNEKDIQDLIELISVVPFHQLKPKFGIMLNPTFGFGSNVVGGADVDLIIDNTIIEIKTTKNLKLVPNDWYQVVGYYVLYKIDLYNAISSKRRIPYPGVPNTLIDSVGIYFSRHGYLFVIKIDSIEQKVLTDFMNWLMDKGNELYDWKTEKE